MAWQARPTSTFGQKPGFGATGAAGGSAFSRPATTGFGAGTTQTFGGAAAGQSRFGAAAPTGFGANKPTTGFGQPAAGAGGFGAKPAGTGFGGGGAAAAPQASNGVPNWRTTPVTETVTQNGSTVQVKCEITAITALDFYKDYTFEYLRYLNLMDPATHPAQQAAATTGGGFGQRPAGGGFGSGAAAATTGGGFGQRPATTGFGAGAATGTTGFGQRPAGTGFGAGAATGAAAGGGFGQRPAGTTGFGSGAATGTTGTTGFGARPATTGFGAKPAGTTGFGAGAAAPRTGFGAGAAQTQQPVFQTGASGFGAGAGAAKFGAGATSFGNNALRTATANVPRDGAAAGGFGARPAGGFGAGATTGYGAGAATGGFGAGGAATSSFQRPTLGYGASAQAQAQEPIYYTTIATSPFGILPQILKDAATPKQPAETPKPTTTNNVATTSTKKKHAMLPHYKLTPRSEMRSAPSTNGIDTEATGRDMFVSKMGGVKKLVIETSDAEQSALFNPAERARLRQGLTTASTNVSTVPSTPSGGLPGVSSSMYMTTPSGYATPSYPPANRERNDTSAIYMAPLSSPSPVAIYTSPNNHGTSPVLTHHVHSATTSQAPKLTIPGCFTVPSLADLRQKTALELARLPEFTVGHSKFGTVTWKTPTDVRNLDLDTLVSFQQDSIEVYPESHFPHGSPADGVLNKTATVKIYNVSVNTLLGKTTSASSSAQSPGKRLSAAEVEQVTNELRRLTASFHGRFISFSSDDNSWTFEVDHFTRYGLAGSNAVPTTTTTTSTHVSPASTKSGPLLHSSRSNRSLGLRQSKLASGTLAPPKSARSRGSSVAHSDEEVSVDLHSAHGGAMDMDEEYDEDFDGQQSQSDDSSGISIHSSDEEDEEEEVSEYSEEDNYDQDEHSEDQSIVEEADEDGHRSDFSQSDSVSQQHSRQGDETRKSQRKRNNPDYDDQSVASRRSRTSRASRRNHSSGQNLPQEPYLLSDLLDEPESRSQRAPHLARQIGLHAPTLQAMKASLFSSPYATSPSDPLSISDRFQTTKRSEIPATFTSTNVPVPSHYPTSPWDSHSSKRFKGPAASAGLSEVKIRPPLTSSLQGPRTPFDPYLPQRFSSRPQTHRATISSEPLAVGKGAETIVAVPLSDSITKDATNVFIDPMLHQGRSSRVCWGPNGTIIHTRFTTVLTSKVVVSPTSASEVLIPALSAHKRFSQLVQSSSNADAALPTVSLREDWNSFVNSQIILSGQQLAEVEKALLAFPSSKTPTPSSSAYELLQEAKVKFQTENQVWLLFKTLFGSTEYQSMIDDYDGSLAAEHLTKLVRKHQLDGFLMKNTLESVKRSLLSLADVPAVEKQWKVLFTLLTGKKIKEAVEMALSMGEHRLAILLAQAADPTTLHQDMKMQLQRWTREGVLGSNLIAPYKLELFSVLAGEVRVVASESRIPDWLRSFAMFFWFSGTNSFSQPLDAVIENYSTLVLADQKRQQSMLVDAADSSLTSFPKLAAPFPTYARELKRFRPLVERKSVLDAQQSEQDQKLDILFHMLRLYRDPAYPLDELLHPLASSPRLLDVSLSWFLQTVLEGAQLGIGPMRQTQITVDFALQLEMAGLWQWSLYVLMSLPSHTALSEHYRNQAMRNVLCRHIEEMESFGFSLKHGGLLGLPIPEVWVLEARAWLYRSRGDWESEIRMHLKSGHYIEAHNVLLNKWGPSVIVDHGVETQNWPQRFLEALETLAQHTSTTASPNSPSIIANWIHGGNIYLSWHQWFSAFRTANDSWSTVASIANSDLARLDSNAFSLIGLVNEWTSALRGLVQIHKERADSTDQPFLPTATAWSKIPALQGPVGLSMKLRQGITLKNVQTELICASEMASKLASCHKDLKILVACESAEIPFPSAISSHAVLIPSVDTSSLLEPLGNMFIPPNELSSNLAYLTSQYLEWRVAAN